MNKPDKKNYIVVESPFGQSIKFDFRPECSLVIFTNFNPVKKLCFIDLLETYGQIAQVTSTHAYDDGTGSIVIKLKEGYEKHIVIKSVSEAFEKEFGVTSLFINVKEKQ